jgi:hypothetical protein
MGLVHFVLREWVWFTLCCVNGFGSVRSAQMALVHLFCRFGFGSVCFAWLPRGMFKRLLKGLIQKFRLALVHALF